MRVLSGLVVVGLLASLFPTQALALGSSRPSAPPATVDQIQKRDRVMLITVSLASGGDAKLRWLYQFLEGSAVSMAQMALTPQYRILYGLVGSNATKAKFISGISNIARDAQNRALDLLVHLHGSRGGLSFQDGYYTTQMLSYELADAKLNGRLRAVYSSACYGDTHSQDFINGGFRVASGSLGVNANSANEYPIWLQNWAGNRTFKEALDAGKSSVLDFIAETAAKIRGFDNVDSTKVIRGNASTRIWTVP